MESQPAGKSGRYKAKAKKAPAKSSKTAKKRKSDGQGCSMFLSELTKKLHKRKQDEEKEAPNNVVHTIINSLTNALPVIFSKKSLDKKDSPPKIEILQNITPELMPTDAFEIFHGAPEDVAMIEEENILAPGLKMPRMPLIDSEIMKPVEKIKIPTTVEHRAINTGCDRDVATELAKHVGTLRKISLIAEEFNQKTAKNLKEIVDSCQQDLIKKLEELQAEENVAKPPDIENIVEEVTDNVK